MLSSTILSTFFFLYVDNRLDDNMYRGVDDHYLEHPCAREQKCDNGHEQGQLFFVGQGSDSFIGAVIRIFCKMTSLIVSFVIGFSAREIFPGC